jgi:hypothetical protein
LHGIFLLVFLRKGVMFGLLFDFRERRLVMTVSASKVQRRSSSLLWGITFIGVFAVLLWAWASGEFHWQAITDGVDNFSSWLSQGNNSVPGEKPLNP